jgi:hypothetical protein
MRTGQARLEIGRGFRRFQLWVAFDDQMVQKRSDADERHVPANGTPRPTQALGCVGLWPALYGARL